MQTKIATCCYCGTRAALVLKGTVKHELACSACGAPLHNLKHMPVEPSKPKKVTSYGGPSRSKPKKKKKSKKRKSLLFEAFDILEDIFD